MADADVVQRAGRGASEVEGMRVVCENMRLLLHHCSVVEDGWQAYSDKAQNGGAEKRAASHDKGKEGEKGGRGEKGEKERERRGRESPDNTTK